MRLIIDELNAAIAGEPWHGDSIQTLLNDVTADQARARPIAAAHSIWEIVRHLTAWTQEVRRRLAGHPPGLPRDRRLAGADRSRCRGMAEGRAVVARRARLARDRDRRDDARAIDRAAAGRAAPRVRVRRNV